MNSLTEYFNGYHEVDAYRIVYPDENVVRFLVSHFAKPVRGTKKVLDLGCGSGRHLILLSELGFQAFGIDRSEVGLNYAEKWLRQRGFSAELSQADISQMPYPNDEFDAIVEHATLVYNDWDCILRSCLECHRVLKPGGVGFFLLKRPEDCAFDQAKEIAKNTYLVAESVFMSRKARQADVQATLRAFTRDDIQQMFHLFSKVKVHTWDLSFKAPNIEAEPGERKTAYWIVLVQK